MLISMSAIFTYRKPQHMAILDKARWCRKHVSKHVCYTRNIAEKMHKSSHVL